MILNEHVILAGLSHRNYLNKKRTKNLKYVNFNFGQCRVCRDQANGIHYGVPSCEGCKVKLSLIPKTNLSLFFRLFSNEVCQNLKTIFVKKLKIVLLIQKKEKNVNCVGGNCA